MSLKICHITTVHRIGDERIFFKESHSLYKAGYDTYVIAPGKDCNLQGVKVLGIGNSRNRIDRFLNLRRAAYKKAKEVNADIYHIHDIELLSLGAALKKQGKRVIYDAHEDTPMQVLDKQWVPVPFRKILSKLIYVFEIHFSKKLDLVITVTPLIEKKFKKYEIPTGIISNFPRLDDKKLKESEKRSNTICFAGGISRQWMHENILDALAELKDVNYILAGNGSQEYLSILKEKKAWEKVNFLGLVSHEQVWDIMQVSNLGMALNDYVANVGYHEGSLGNTKLFEYMYAGLPVVATDFRVWKEIVEGHNCGLCVNPRDVKAISNAIQTLLTQPQLAKQMGENGRKIVEERYNWNEEEKKLLQLYAQLS